MTPRIKICCIQNLDEARLAIAGGASAIGLVGKMPSGPGPITDAEIYSIAQNIPPHIATFLLTSEISGRKIAEHHARTQTTTIQIVDDIPDEDYDKIRFAIPEIKLVQVIHVIGEVSVEEAIRKANYVDMILLDSGNPNLAVKELGGTGRVHNWQISRKIVEAVKKPVFLAGGLNSENARAAIDTVNPYGLRSHQHSNRRENFRIGLRIGQINRLKKRRISHQSEGT